MRSGEVAKATGLYRTTCTCAVTLEIPRGASAPVCPKCREDVQWAFHRSTFRPDAEAGAARKAPPREA